MEDAAATDPGVRRDEQSFDDLRPALRRHRFLRVCAMAVLGVAACDEPRPHAAPPPVEELAWGEAPAEPDPVVEPRPRAVPEPCEPGTQVDVPPFVDDTRTRFLHRALLRAMESARDPERGTLIRIGGASLYGRACSELDPASCRVRVRGWRSSDGPSNFDAPLIVAAAARLNRRLQAQSMIDEDMRRASEDARATGAAIVPWLGVITAKETRDGWHYGLHVLPSVLDALRPPSTLPPLASRDVDAMLEAHRGVCLSPGEIRTAAARLLATGARAEEPPTEPTPEHPEAIRALFESGVHFVTFVPTAGSASEIGQSVGGDSFRYDPAEVRSVSICDHEYGRDRCDIGRTTPQRFAASALLTTALWTALHEPVPDRPGVRREARRLEDRDWARAVATLARLDPSVHYAGFWYLGT